MKKYYCNHFLNRRGSNHGYVYSRGAYRISIRYHSQDNDELSFIGNPDENNLYIKDLIHHLFFGKGLNHNYTTDKRLENYHCS